MRGLLLSLMFTFSTAALACPNLAGDRKIIFDNGYEMAQTITQTVENGVNVYDTGIFGGVMIADGVERITNKPGNLVQVRRVTCDGTILNIKQTDQQLNDDGSLKCQMIRLMTMTPADDLVINYTVKAETDTCQN